MPLPLASFLVGFLVSGDSPSSSKGLGSSPGVIGFVVSEGVLDAGVSGEGVELADSGLVPGRIFDGFVVVSDSGGEVSLGLVGAVGLLSRGRGSAPGVIGF
mgnify:FL=1